MTYKYISQQCQLSSHPCHCIIISWNIAELSHPQQWTQRTSGIRPVDEVLQAHTHTHPFNGSFPGLPRWAGTRKGKPIWILLKQETVSGSGISWAICKSAPCSRQITMPAPHHSVFYRPDALPAAQPTVSKHWRQKVLQAITQKWHDRGSALKISQLNIQFAAHHE